MTDYEQGNAMLTHHQVWAAIEALAQRHGMTASGLARRSGLDPTTFNRSKRIGSDGRQRWPSTESIAKILEATNVTLDEFLTLLREMEKDDKGGGFAEAGQPAYVIPSLKQSDASWRSLEFPGAPDASLLLFEVMTDGLLPVYSSGAKLIAARTAKVSAGDRIILADKGGALLIRKLIRKTRRQLFLQSWRPAEPDSVVESSDILWTAKILWASQ